MLKHKCTNMVKNRIIRTINILNYPLVFAHKTFYVIFIFEYDMKEISPTKNK